MSKAAEKDPKTSGWNGEGEPTTAAETPAQAGSAPNGGSTSPTTQKPSTTPTSNSVTPTGTNNSGEEIVINDWTPDITMRLDNNQPFYRTPQQGDTIEKVSEPDKDGYMKVTVHTADGESYTGTMSNSEYDGLVEGFDF